MVGFSAQLRKPGDFLTNSDTGQAILVTRGLDNKLRAFLNVCRHRSATVELAACGANLVAKCALAFAYGTARFGAALTAIAAVAIAAASSKACGLAAAFQPAKTSRVARATPGLTSTA